MKHPFFIGLGHKKQRGKDTFAEFVAGALGSRAAIVHFADPLKRFCADVFGIDHDKLVRDKEAETTITNLDLEGPKSPGTMHSQYYLTARQVLQRAGVTLRQAIDGVWSMAPFRKLWGPDIQYVIIPDVRFSDEVRNIRQHGGLVFRVDRPQLDVGPQDGHESETQLDSFKGWDFVVQNIGSLDLLRNIAETAVEHLIIPRRTALSTMK